MENKTTFVLINIDYEQNELVHHVEKSSISLGFLVVCSFLHCLLVKNTFCFTHGSQET